MAAAGSDAGASTWEEVRGLMGQLEQLGAASVSPAAGGLGGGGGGSAAAVAAQSDLETVRLLAQARGELRDVMAASETGARKAILDLSRAVAGEHAAAGELAQPLDSLRLQIEALDAAKARVSQQLQSLQSSKDASAAAINRLLSSTLQYKEMLSTLQQDAAAQVPRTKHFLTLYAIISAIKWDYEGGEGAAVEGCECHGCCCKRTESEMIETHALRPVFHKRPADIAPPGGAPVRPFRFDASMPPFPLADALWGVVGEAHGQR